MELTLLVQYSMLIKAMMEKGTSNHYLAYTYVLPNIKQRTNAKKGKNRKKAAKIFNVSIYHYRGLIEGIFGAEEIKHHQLYCRFRLKNNQKRFGLIKSIGWNLEVLNRLQCANKLGLKITQYAISNYATTPGYASYYNYHFRYLFSLLKKLHSNLRKPVNSYLF